MSWCHNCNCEFVDGVQHCSDCGAPLLGYPPEDPARVWYEGAVEPVLLYTASDTLEADSLEALLRSEGLMVVRRYHGAGQYLSVSNGRARVEVGLYVHPDLVEQARAVLDAMSLGEEEIPPGELLDETGIRTLRRLRGWILILVFIGSTLVVASGQIAAFFQMIVEMLGHK